MLGQLRRVRLAFRFVVFWAFLWALLLALSPLVARAGTIAVDGTTCTIPEAVPVANLDDDSGSDCTLVGGAPGAADTLNLSGSLHAIDVVAPLAFDGPTAAQNITSTITIVGDPNPGGRQFGGRAAPTIASFTFIRLADLPSRM